MANFIKTAEIEIPSILKIYSNFGEPTIIDKNISIIKKVKSLYGSFIKKWCGVLEIDENIFTSFVCTESMGIAGAYNSGSGASGLTQVTSIAIREAFSRFKTVTGQPIPTEIVSYVKSVAPYLLELSQNSQNLSALNESKLKASILANPQFNIICGAIVFRWNLNFLKYNNEGHVNRVIIGYNQGSYGRIQYYKGKPVTTLELYKDKKIPFETRCYLVKVLGVFGYMDLIKRNKL
jgi:hypothetical protein